MSKKLPVGKRLAQTADSLTAAIKAYLIEKGQWDFDKNAPKPIKDNHANTQQ